ncbi:MAG: hypothetical protein RKP46_12495 [Candidatus Accumulibacter sp.]|uniref:hypothetical protein n=1 Tax=Accumulibacter sp. TaxID=2053492 RepID=UPI0028797ACE|nr:hypothetical protein [Accumulibacter sp.]MDS4015148.1 hypothetical protein [Accumulibacter sp.]
MGFTLFQHVALIAHRAETQWPPTYPRRGTLLTPSDDPTIPREAWGADEWKAYALFLEEAGSKMAERLQRAQSDLRDVRMKLTRRRKAGAPHSTFTTLLACEPAQPKKRGRKPAEHTRRLAESALAIRSEAATKGLKLTDRKALEEAFAAVGQRKTRANGNAARHILNTMSKLRGRHANSIS